MEHHYEKILPFLQKLEPETFNACQQIMHDNSERFNLAPGSYKKHQAWPGGYIDHLYECMSMASDIYTVFSNKRTLPFTLNDAILVLFLHDLEKPFKYTEPKKVFLDHVEQDHFKYEMIKNYGIILTPEQDNALLYIHGEGSDYHPEKNIMGPLAAFVHSVDTMSARMWHLEPKQSGYLS